MLGRKPWVRCPPASSDMPISRWLPSLARSFSQSASDRSLTCLAPSLGQARGLDAGGQDGPVRDEVGVDARVRLHVGVGRAEQLAGVLGGHGLDGVDVLAAGVEPVPDGALGVLVGEPGAHGQQHRRRRVVLAGDQLERIPLVGKLFARRRGDARFDGLDDLQDRRGRRRSRCRRTRRRERSGVVTESAVMRIQPNAPMRSSPDLRGSALPRQPQRRRDQRLVEQPAEPLGRG